MSAPGCQGSDLRPMAFFEEAPNAWGSPSPPSCSRPPQSNIIGPWAPKVDIDTPPQFEKRWGTHVDIGAPAQSEAMDGAQTRISSCASPTEALLGT